MGSKGSGSGLFDKDLGWVGVGVLVCECFFFILRLIGKKTLAKAKLI